MVVTLERVTNILVTPFQEMGATTVVMTVASANHAKSIKYFSTIGWL
jgi:hypothetical protein